jgi:hypothetical protein
MSTMIARCDGNSPGAQQRKSLVVTKQ